MIEAKDIYPDAKMLSKRQKERLKAANELAAAYLRDGMASSLKEAENLAILQLKRVWQWFD
jgi:hypothetical protein